LYYLKYFFFFPWYYKLSLKLGTYTYIKILFMIINNRMIYIMETGKIINKDKYILILLLLLFFT